MPSIIERVVPLIKVYYREREPGMNIYSINDTTGRYFPEPYCLESFDNTPEYFMTIEEAGALGW